MFFSRYFKPERGLSLQQVFILFGGH